VGTGIAQQDQVTWNVAENFAVFVDSIKRLSTRLEETRANADIGNSVPILSFDKDDVDTLDFVVASANLRSHIFGIEMRSKFDIKRRGTTYTVGTAANKIQKWLATLFLRLRLQTP
jgi:ubiquitin-like 1-activating enzyme E1 B